MLADLKPYPETRDSGIEWLGEIPAHWETRRVRSVARVLNGATPSTSAPAYWEGDIPWITPEDLGRLKTRYIDDSARRITRTGYASCGTSLAPDNSLAISTRAPIGHIGILRRAACVNQGCRLLIPDDSVHAEYLYYELLASRPGLEALGQGTTFLELSSGKLSGFTLALPPLTEQAAIVRFLDHADRRIRRYIRAKQKLIALLEEQKRAVIHQAVTGRIDVRTGRPYPSYRESGVKWQGAIPEHWGYRRLKSLVKRVDQGVSPQAENYVADGDSWGVLKAGCVNTGEFRESEHKRLPSDFVFDPALTVQLGDVLVSRASGSPRLVGSVGRVSVLKYRLILSDKTFRLVFTDEVDPDFMVLAMKGPHYRQQVEQAISGADGLANNLPLSSLRTFFFAIPTIDEQRAVVRHVTTILGDRLAGAVKQAKRNVALLEEYRTRLIADVVTGKLDARAVADRLRENSVGEEPSDGECDLGN